MITVEVVNMLLYFNVLADNNSIVNMLVFRIKWWLYDYMTSY